jgi:hypothetical protein
MCGSSSIERISLIKHLPLHCAASWKGHIECVRLLLSSGCSLLIPDHAGQTILEAAHPSVRRLLASFEGLSSGEKASQLKNGDEEASTTSPQSDSLSAPPLATLTDCNAYTIDPPPPTLWIVIPPGAKHAGAGSFVLDGFFSGAFLQQVDDLFSRLPIAHSSKPSCSARAYFCDSSNWVTAAMSAALDRARRSYSACNADGESASCDVRSWPGAEDLWDKATDTDASPERQSFCSRPMPHMRFLHYEHVGGYLPPHVDLRRTDDQGNKSTHTFILYLADCREGGETSLLRYLPKTSPSKRGKKLWKRA